MLKKLYHLLFALMLAALFSSVNAEAHITQKENRLFSETAQTNNPPVTNTTDKNENLYEDDDMNWGWIGLLGLLGLMGMKKQRKKHKQKP